MYSVIVENDVEEVVVNKRGDTIEIAKDMTILNDIMNFKTKITAIGNEFNRLAAKVDTSDVDTQHALTYSLQKELHDYIDELFGVDACKKIYGNGVKDTLPDLLKTMKFFKELTPVIKDIMKGVEADYKKAKREELKTSDFKGHSETVVNFKKVNKESSFDEIRRLLDGGDTNEV